MGNSVVFSFDTLWVALFRLLLATVVGSVIGMERGRQGRAAGMRTHVLVCLGAALTAMTGMYAYEILGVGNDPLRISAQVISGIGFLGVGSILIKGRFQITGLTTSAGLWTAAAIGLALGIGYYEGALVTFMLAVITVTILHRLEYKVFIRHVRFGIYVEICSDTEVRKTVEFLGDNWKVTDIQVTSPRSGKAGNVGIEAIIHTKGLTPTPNEVAAVLEKEEQVLFALESI